jgi:talin
MFRFFQNQDFGDYASAYYSVQTHEGQQISQLIAGYIDIILKKVLVLIE